MGCPLEIAFADNLRSGADLGASVSLWVDGRETLTLAHGWRDRERAVAWDADTPVLLWSAGKGPAAACALECLHGAGIGLREPVASVWPEFAGNGKGRITFAELLSHRAGLAALDENVPMTDHDAVARALERQRPHVVPGHAYHPRTFGFILDEIVRRMTGGTPLARFFSERFARPLGLRFWFGVPDDMAADVATIYGPKAGPPPPNPRFAAAFADPTSLTARAFASPSGASTPSAMNRPENRAVSYPGFGAIGTARSLAVFYSHLLGRPYIGWLTTPLADGFDGVLLEHTAFSAGMMLAPPERSGKKTRRIFGPSAAAFGHPGAGGCIGFADPENGIAFAYAGNQMEQGAIPGRRTLDLIDTVYSTGMPGKSR